MRPVRVKYDAQMHRGQKQGSKENINLAENVN